MSLPTQQCPQCQKRMAGDARFCSDCGTRLHWDEQASTPAQQTMSDDVKSARSLDPEKSDAPAPTSTPSTSASDSVVWRKHGDEWNGFSLARPSGWEVRTTNGWISVCQDIAGLTKAIINPFQLPQSIGADELARKLVKTAQTVNKTYTAWKMHAEDITYHEMQQSTSMDQVILRVRFVEEQTQIAGVLSVIVDGNSAIVSGFQAPEHKIEKLKPIFQRILASFHTEARLPRTTFVETDKRTFTASIPTGWQATGKIIPTPTGGETILFLAQDSERKMRAEIPGRTFLYLERNELERQAQTPQPHFPSPTPYGSSYASPLSYPGNAPLPALPPTMPYLSASAFLEQILVPEMRQHSSNFQVERIVNRADRANAFIPSGQPTGKRPTIATLQCTFTENSVLYRQKISLLVLPPGPAGPTWTATVESSIRTPLDLFARYEPTLEGIIASVQLSPEAVQELKLRLQQGQQKLDQQRIQLQQIQAENQQILLQGQMQRNEIRRNAQNYAFSVYQSAAQQQQQMFHQGVQAFTHNYIQGYGYVRNPYSGEVYDVPVGYNHYWVNGPGNVVMGSNSPYSPGYDFQPLDPLDG